MISTFMDLSSKLHMWDKLQWSSDDVSQRRHHIFATILQEDIAIENEGHQNRCLNPAKSLKGPMKQMIQKMFEQRLAENINNIKPELK